MHILNQEDSKNIIRFLVFSLLSIFTFPFLLLRGDLDSCFITSFLISLAIYFLKTFIGKVYTFGIILIICVLLYYLHLNVDKKRNFNSTEIAITGIIQNGNFSRGKKSKNSHAYFKIAEYPYITFISREFDVMQSFKRYRLDSTAKTSRNRLKIYNTVNFNTGKHCRFKVKKSHLDWCKKPHILFWSKLRYPLEIEIIDFQLD